jgi:hypothetical protein
VTSHIESNGEQDGSKNPESNTALSEGNDEAHGDGGKDHMDAANVLLGLMGGSSGSE